MTFSLDIFAQDVTGDKNAFQPLNEQVTAKLPFFYQIFNFMWSQLPYFMCQLILGLVIHFQKGFHFPSCFGILLSNPLPSFLPNILYCLKALLHGTIFAMLLRQVAQSIAACNLPHNAKNVARQVAALSLLLLLAMLASALHHVATCTTCVATTLWSRLQRKLHLVTGPLMCVAATGGKTSWIINRSLTSRSCCRNISFYKNWIDWSLFCFSVICWSWYWSLLFVTF